MHAEGKEQIPRENTCGIFEQVFGGKRARSRLVKEMKKSFCQDGFGVLVCVTWGLLKSLRRIMEWSKLQSPQLPKEYETAGEQGQLLVDQVKGKEWAVVVSGRFWIYFKEQNLLTDEKERSQEIIKCYNLQQCFSNFNVHHNLQEGMLRYCWASAPEFDSVGLDWSLRYTTLPARKTNCQLLS